MTAPARLCRGCAQELPPKHLRTQLAPPDSKWHEARTHDLGCLIDFLEREEEALLEGRDGELFKAGHLPADGQPRP